MPIFEFNITQNLEDGDESPADTDKHTMKFNKKSSFEVLGSESQQKKQERELELLVLAELQKKKEKEISNKTPSSVDIEPECISNKYFAESKYSKEYVKQKTKLSHIS